MKNLFQGFILFFFSIGIFYVCLADGQPVNIPVASRGILDLRNQDLSAKPLALHGEWRFFWKQLLSPGDSVDTNPSFVSYPSLWKNDSFGGQKLSSQGYATYTLTVLLPEGRPQLALEIPDVYASYTLYLNGKLFSKNGKPGKSAGEATPFWATHIVHIPDRPDTLSFVMQVANFWHTKGGTYKEILLGKQDQLFLQHQRNIAFDLVLTGCLFMGGLFFLGLFLFGRHDKAILYFSLFCIIYSYRLIGTDIYVLHSLFPGLNWFITTRLEYLSLSFGVALFGQYTRYLYPKDSIPIIVKVFTWVCVLFSLTILFTPTTVFTHFLTAFLVVLFFCTGYVFYVYILAAGNKRSGSVYALFSTAVMMLIFLLINLHYFNVLPAMKAVVFACYIIFFFLQSLALSHRFALTFRQAAAEAQEGLKIKSEFLSTMSHEIRTPLNSVIGMTYLLLKSKPREDQKENLNALYFSANNLLSIVNNILDYNKIEAGKISFEHIPFDLASMSRHIVAGLKNEATEKNIDLRLVIDEKLNKKLIGDPTRTSQVINNLVHNAIKFTKEGWVRLSISVSSVNEVSVSILVSVDDTGIGISMEKQQMIFDRFTQADSSTSRSFGGTGLGLAITKKILELQGIILCLRSEPGKGSAFYFTQVFPVSTEDIETEKDDMRHFSNNEQSLMGISILLVEDNPLNIIVAQTILENSGAKVDVATNGQEALDKFNPRKHQLILMDLHMPVMDGYEATRQLRKRGEKLPVIALTASTPKEVESEATAAGITDIVVKPFNPEDLYRLILQYIR
jgi:signal transduction histidine kinase/CheY-like chemotaxis protein